VHRARASLAQRDRGRRAEMDINYLACCAWRKNWAGDALARCGWSIERDCMGNCYQFMPLQLPSHGTFSASKAAALSLSQCCALKCAQAACG